MPTTNSVPKQDDSIWAELALLAVLQNRAEQDRIGQTVTTKVGALFDRHLDYTRLTETQWLFAEAALPVVEDGWQQSIQASNDMFMSLKVLDRLRSDRNYRVPAFPRTITAAQFGRERVIRGPEVVVPSLPRPQTATALVGESAGRIRHRMPVPADVIMPVARKATAGAAERAALDGGRQQMRTVSQEDTGCVGFQRVTDSDPCYFCALLAANGPAYKKDSSFAGSDRKFKANKIFGGSEPDNIAKVHNHCRCVLVPVFEGFEIDDPIGLFADDLWGDVVGDGFSGREALNVFRTRYENHPSLPFRTPKGSGGVANAFTAVGNAGAASFIRSLAA